MDKRTETLIEQEWSEPFDAEPFESPDVWEYRGLMNTGGGMFCRIWTHQEKELELLYGMVVNTVSVIGAKYDAPADGYVGDLDDVVAQVTLDDGYTEEDKREEAKDLLREYA